MNSVRVRFAPSPTGHLHIGSLRTALFNYLFARHENGTFLVRIEDTDQERSQDIFVQSILDSLAWAEIIPDESIVFQTERMDLYKRKIDLLLAQDKAYRCYCPPKPEHIGDDTLMLGQAYLKYDGRCRARAYEHGDEQRPHVIRFKFPLNKDTISFHDIIRGLIVFDADQFDDFVLVRTDGIPVYNFVVVVDDIDMHISHIIRGEDHISNTAKQLLLYQALDAQIPFFAHIPLILGASGQRLSKRDAATSVLEYRENGYLPNALCNYLLRLGWAHGDQEIFTRDDMIKLFTLSQIGKSNAIFDQDKLDWMNGLYIRALSNDALFNYIILFVASDLSDLLKNWSKEGIEQCIGLYKDRVKTLKELVNILRQIHNHAGIPTGFYGNRSQDIEYVHAFLAQLKTMSEFNTESLKQLAQTVCKKFNIALKHVAYPIRVALTGQENGPGFVELILFLGKDESIKRLECYISWAQNKRGDV